MVRGRRLCLHKRPATIIFSLIDDRFAQRITRLVRRIGATIGEALFFNSVSGFLVFFRFRVLWVVGGCYYLAFTNFLPFSFVCAEDRVT